MSHPHNATAGAASSAPQSRAWIWQGLALTGLLALLYWSVIPPLLDDWWNNPDFSHGFLVPPFAALVAWSNRARLATIPVQPAWMGLVLMAGALMVLVVGVLGAELFLQRSSMILLLAAMVVYFFGWGYFRALLFPLAFLFLAVPIPAILFNQVTIPLQFLASDLSSWLLAALGVPVLQQGNIIQLPSMTLEVAEACSGIRSLLSLTTVAVVFGYFAMPTAWPRAVLALAAIPIAVIANGLRVAGTGIIGQYWGQEKAEGFFHSFSGWVVFVVSLALLFGLQAAMARLLPRFFSGRRS